MHGKQYHWWSPNDHHIACRWFENISQVCHWSNKDHTMVWIHIWQRAHVSRKGPWLPRHKFRLHDGQRKGEHFNGTILQTGYTRVYRSNNRISSLTSCCPSIWRSKWHIEKNTRWDLCVSFSSRCGAIIICHNMVPTWRMAHRQQSLSYVHGLESQMKMIGENWNDCSNISEALYICLLS